MNGEQHEVMERIKKTWAGSGTVYPDIIEKDDIVYMLLGNGTAQSIDTEGRLDWVTEGWKGGISIVRRPCHCMTFVPEKQGYYCVIDTEPCPGVEGCERRKVIVTGHGDRHARELQLITNGCIIQWNDGSSSKFKLV